LQPVVRARRQRRPRRRLRRARTRGRPRSGPAWRRPRIDAPALRPGRLLWRGL